MADQKISKDLFLAVLAMDSYNRGYNAGIADGEGTTDANGDDADGLGEAGEKIGAATVLDFDLPANSQSAGFYALAYDIGADGPEGLAGKTVISFRGTDTSLDHSTGWSVGAGNIDDWTQAPRALEVHTAATGHSYRKGQANAVILRGHAPAFGSAA
ncbi:hypothetical protein RAZWK3B_19101 [Roseobacter sp. AzwK-3b]|uniref:hypothetical protein n=1 Tax=Roseobacter sp. AzwK-3b TaxID=351016 RepID=UPI0001569D1F|nr:hypothetical protein [Roseobacter sp. AzwK-3b]EDM71491.1 hypothetical protein RAZWK3B_19101 [Roseobacter sp. AzwK-3b]